MVTIYCRGIAVLLVGHSKFGPVEVLRMLDQWVINLPDRSVTLQTLKPRMLFEDLYGDLKRHGFDLWCLSCRAQFTLDPVVGKALRV